MLITTLAAARFRVLEEVGWPAEKDQKNAALRDRRVRADVRGIQASGVTVAIGKFPIESCRREQTEPRLVVDNNANEGPVIEHKSKDGVA